MRKGPGSVGARYLAAAFAVAILQGCVTRTYQNAIEVKGNHSLEEKVRWAQSFTTEERLALLKAQLKQRLPSVTDNQLSTLSLKWTETHFKSFTGKGSSSAVTVSVGIQFDSSFDPKPIIGAAAEILESEINARERIQ
jgi:hypothetical protein